MLFPTAVIGSMPRPAFLRELLAHPPTHDPSEYERLMQIAIRYIVALQEQAGIDVISDGEWRRISYLGVIAQLSYGFNIENHPLPGRPLVITVTEKLRPKHPGFLATEIEFLRSITKNPIKATLPSPGLLGERMWHAEKSKDVYPDRKDFVRACVPILKEELKLLANAGADIIQIDDPHLCLFVDDSVRNQYVDPDAEAQFDVEMINELVAGINAKICVHLCRRAGARSRGDAQYAGSFDPIVKQLNQLNVRQLTMEFTAEGSGDSSTVTKLREDFEIGLGCLSVHHGQIDTVDIIVSRVEEAMKHVEKERLILTPDCGFAPSATAIVSLDEVYKKLKNLAEAAQVLRRKYA